MRKMLAIMRSPAVIAVSLYLTLGIGCAELERNMSDTVAGHFAGLTPAKRQP
jgi:hypothetical protein